MKFLITWAGAALVAALTSTTPTRQVVTMDGVRFGPEMLTVKQGDAVVWDNRDPFPHSATAAGAFDSGSIAAGRRWTWVAGTPGRFEYLCSFHPGMKGTLIVDAR